MTHTEDENDRAALDTHAGLDPKALEDAIEAFRADEPGDWPRSIACAVAAYLAALSPKPDGGALSETTKAIKAIAEGYPITVWGDRWIRVKNPEFEEGNGSNPGLVIDAHYASAPVQAPVAPVAVKPIGYMRDKDSDGTSFWVSKTQNAYYGKPVYAAALVAVPAPPVDGLQITDAMISAGVKAKNGYRLTPHLAGTWRGDIATREEVEIILRAALSAPQWGVPEGKLDTATIEACAKVAEGPIYKEYCRGREGHNWSADRHYSNLYGNGRMDAADEIRSLAASQGGPTS